MLEAHGSSVPCDTRAEHWLHDPGREAASGADNRHTMFSCLLLEGAWTGKRLHSHFSGILSICNIRAAVVAQETSPAVESIINYGSSMGQGIGSENHACL